MKSETAARPVLPLLPLYAKKFGLGEHGWQLGLLMAGIADSIPAEPIGWEHESSYPPTR